MSFSGTFSIVVPCYFSAATLPACLESLDRQTWRDFEVIVVDSTPGDRSCEAVAAAHSRTRYYHHSERLGAHAARNAGARMAQGEWLAFIDPDMTAGPEWLETFREAFASGHATVAGGGVDCPPSYWARAVHLTKYGWWLAGGRAATRPQLPSGNLSLPRQLFLEMHGFPDRFWEGDTELSYALRARGIELWHLPEARTVHCDSPTPGGFLRERWERGVDTARARMGRLRWTALQRGMRILAAPLTWLVMMLRSARLAFRSGWGARWLLAMPVVALGLGAWICGECRTLARGR